MENTREERKERALLVGFATSSKDRWEALDSLEELHQLAETAGYEVFEKFLQIRPQIDPAYYIGVGKAKELGEIARQYGIDIIIFDFELTHAQARNLEKVMGIRVMDRTQLIMKIFESRARTSEAKIQVELAQLEYALTHLVGRGKELSRLGGGIGTRGPGEKELEMEKRRIKDRITALRKKLQIIERTKKIHRKARRDFIKIALVGYTNVGKSTIMNLLTDASVYVDDKLFATLDATTRLLKLPGVPYKVVLSDTVGFIKDIPPGLIASFKVTLGVIEDADLILHVVDISHPNMEEHIKTVEKTLEDMNLKDKPVLLVFNKIDMLLDRNVIYRLRQKYPNSVFISARLKENIDELVEKIKEMLEENFRTFEVEIPLEKFDKYSALKKYAYIEEEDFTDSAVRVKGIIHRKFQKILEE